MIPKFLQPERVPYASVEIVPAPTKLICAWCPEFDATAPVPAGSSHGICPSCSAKALGEAPVSAVERTIEERQRTPGEARRGQALKAALLILLVVILPTPAFAQACIEHYLVTPTAVIQLACVPLHPIAPVARIPWAPAPYLVMVAGNVADLWTTRQAIGRGAVEANPLLAGGSRKTLELAKVGGTVALVVLMRALETHGHPRVAQIFGYVDGAATVAVAVSNARVQR